MLSLARLLSILLLVATGCSIAQAESRPNFIIFVADDLAWDDVGAYGNPSIRTPHLDQIAQEGMRFDRAFLTCSSCSPSRCSMLTGRYPHNTGAAELHQPLPGSQRLVTTPLRDAGYYTACAGKWHLGPEVESQWDLIRKGGGPGAEEHWLEVLRERPQDQPFFFWFAAVDPHRDYQPGAIDPPHLPDAVRVPEIFPDTPEVRRDLALYYDEIGRFDQYVGLILEELQRQEILDETWILVITDNGRPFPRCKTRINVDGIKTPFLVRYPRLIEAGTTSDSLISTLDIAPTVLELAGLEPGPSFQGTSIVPVFEDPAQEIQQFVFAEHNWHDYRAFERAVISRDYLLIRNWLPELPGTPPADAVRSPTYREMIRLHEEGQLSPAQAAVFAAPRSERELYHWTSDPHCLHNLAGNAQTATVQATLESALASWQSATEDRFPGRDALTPDRFDRQSGEPLSEPQ